MTIARQRTRGMTLIELMIVVAIIAILASIAIPSYRAYILRSQRSDATVALQRVAAAQEKFYLQSNTYSSDATALLGRTTSEHGWYTLAITDATATGYRATATPVAGGPQAADTECPSFEIRETGQRLPDPSTSKCWR